MNPCQEHQEQIHLLIDGELPRHQQPAVLQHIQSCAGCRQLHDGLRQTREALAELESHTDDEGLLVVDRPHRALKGLTFSVRGNPSEHATRRLHEIRGNVS